MPDPVFMPCEGTVLEWRKQVGEPVKRGDVLLVVEADKSVVEVECPREGVLLRVLVEAGTGAAKQAILAYTGQPGERVPFPVAPHSIALTESKIAESPAKRPSTGVAGIVVPVRSPVAGTNQVKLQAASNPVPPTGSLNSHKVSPRAARLARVRGLVASYLRGSGPGARILESDVLMRVNQEDYRRMRITPAARKLAAKEGLHVPDLEGTGESGRIRIADVNRALAERPQPLSKMRRIIAQKLVKSVVTAPHFFVTIEADLTDLIELRSRLKTEARNYSLTDFIAYEVVRALREFPELNSTTDGEMVRWHSRVHLGLAVSINEGLIVPVLRNAGAMSFWELGFRIKDLVDRARRRVLPAEELTGSTFTISNMGMMDVDNFTAILNPGEAGILAVSSIRKRVVPREEAFEIRSMMNMTMSSDHRLVDGALAARFLNTIKQGLQDRLKWEEITD